MEKRKKWWALAFLSAAIAILIVLAASLAQLEFEPGRPFSLGEPDITAVGGEAPGGGGEIVLLILRGVLALALVLLPIYIIFSLLTPEGRARLLSDLFLILAIILLLSLLSQNSANPPTEETLLSAPAQGPLAPVSSEPTDEFVADVPPWLDIVAIAALATLVSGVVTAIVWWIIKRRKIVPLQPLEQLAQRAQDTIDALRAGEDIKDTVIKSYVQMGHVLERERGIRREAAMTPYEFEQLLTGQGLPPEPVRELTRLFAQVRYGNQVADEREKRVAINSLQAIVMYCRRARAGQ